MKNYFAILILLLTSLLATSCWKVDEDWSLCEERLVVDMSLEGVPDAKFTDYIYVVDVYLFDANLEFLQTRKLSSAMLEESLQTTFEVAPGTYHVVCWANMGNNTQVSFKEGHILNNYIELVSLETGDPLYYAPNKTPEIYPKSRADQPDYSIYKAEVVAGRVTIKDMVFAKAHRTVEVFISGWEYLKLGGVPVVERQQAGGWYDFLLRYDITDPVRFRRSTSLVVIDGVQYYNTKFHSALIPLEGETKWVWLSNPATGEPIIDPDTYVDLKRYVAANNIEDDSYIPIYYRFTDNGGHGQGNVSVNIELPPWRNHNVEPGF